ncbi:MAG: carbohydrate kinase family protein [Lachnospiraceae bacterium]|nr:carbohydrate kinase family protein [Lachnospiraceae bacterium]
MTKKKVIVAGHICLDITPVFPDKKVKHPGEILSPGKLVQMGAADVHSGGCVANTGLAMKILGADVTLMGKIGTDAFGDMVCNVLKRYGAESGMLRDKKLSTSYSVVLALPGIDRIFLHNPGANDSFLADDIAQEALRDISLFHFGYPTLMRSMYEADGEELCKLMKRMKDAGIATSLDMAAVDADSEAGCADWKKILQRTLPFVDFFVPSVEELCFMLDRDRFIQWQRRADGADVTGVLDVEEDIRPLAEQCMEFGAKVLLIKCGAPGMYYCTAKEEILQKIGGGLPWNLSQWADRAGFEKSYVPEKIVSGTGAGDTSIAAFLTAVLEGCPLAEALQLAAGTGASCVEAYDALSGLRSFPELREKMKSGWQKNE